MDKAMLQSEDLIWRWRFRIACLLILIGEIAAAHWLLPHNSYYLHAFHIVFCKFYFLAAVLAAIWFNLKGSILAAALITLLYSLHVIFQWRGELSDNINQVGELATIWLTAILSGIFVRIEKKALRDVSEAHEGSLIALAAALDAREHDTELHSLRVKAYALRLGREIGLDQEKMQVLGQASLLHDVGKIGTPDNILLKPGSLDDEEWKIMRQHPQIGQRILLSVPFLKDSAEIVYCHHEKYDGSGYSRGLEKEQIPIESRVFAVADVFDALTSNRPYRQGMSYEETKDLIEKESGKHFDPKVVEAFMRVSSSEWNEIEKQVSEHAACITCREDNNC